MSNLIKKLFLTLLILIFVSFIPIYGMVRFVVPDIIIDKISEKLPKGSKFSVKTVKSNLDMSISYEGVFYSDPMVNVIIPELTVKTLPNFKKPFIVETGKLEILNPKYSIIFENLKIKTIFNEFSLDGLDLQGSFEKLNAIETAILLNAEFVITGLRDKTKNINLESEKIIVDFQTPNGPANLIFNEGKMLIDKEENFDFNFNFKDSFINLSNLNKNDDLILKTDDLSFNFSFNGNNQLIAPFKIDLSKATSNSNKLAEKIKVFGKAKWRFYDKNCKTLDSVFSKINCGKLTDFVDVNFLLKDKQGKISMIGDGFCVAPQSGCLQEINARIESNETNEVFTTLIQSGIINPVISGILMGSLISSEESPSDTFEHAVNFNVKGSQILINGKSLLN